MNTIVLIFNINKEKDNISYKCIHAHIKLNRGKQKKKTGNV